MPSILLSTEADFENLVDRYIGKVGKNCHYKFRKYKSKDFTPTSYPAQIIWTMSPTIDGQIVYPADFMMFVL